MTQGPGESVQQENMKGNTGEQEEMEFSIRAQVTKGQVSVKTI